MTTCRNCRSSLPDGSKFCSMCGYQTGELATTLSSSREDVPPNSPANDEKTTPSGNLVPEWVNSSSTKSPSDPTYGEHRQPRPFHWIQPVHGLYQQLQGMHAAHSQSAANHTRHLHKIRSGYRPSWQLIAISSVILVTIITLGTLFVANYSKNNINVAITSNTNLVPAGKAIPGQTLQVVGNHFPASQTVFITLDGQPLVNNGTMEHTRRLSVANLGSVSSANVNGTSVAVDANGTFTVPIQIDSNWKAGSIHHLTAFNQQGKELKSLDLKVEDNQSKPATSATGMIEIENIDMQNPLYLPAETILTNAAGCTAQKLQISLDSDVNLDAYSGEYTYPRMTVPIHVVQPGTTGNIQDCKEGYAFHYCFPACDSSETWDAYDTNSGFSGGTDSQR
jgi:hypothetical protein